VRAHGAATTAAYCYDAVTVLPRCRNKYVRFFFIIFFIRVSILALFNYSDLINNI
jgi:hypothetical protein